MVHDHVLGNCRGTLVFDSAGVTFFSGKDGDSFKHRQLEYSYELSGDRLVIRAGSKTYRFRPSNASTKEESRLLVSEMYRTISEFYRSSEK